MGIIGDLDCVQEPENTWQLLHTLHPSGAKVFEPVRSSCPLHANRIKCRVRIEMPDVQIAGPDIGWE